MTQQPTRNTVTYRTVNGLDLEFDYFLPDKVEGKEDKLGVVVWFHGGGLIQVSSLDFPAQSDSLLETDLFFRRKGTRKSENTSLSLSLFLLLLLLLLSILR